MVDVDKARELGHEILDTAGIEVGGDRPQDIAVHDDRFWARGLGRPRARARRDVSGGLVGRQPARRVHRRGAGPRPALAGAAQARAHPANPHGPDPQPPDGAAGPPERRRPLQHRQRPVRANARQPHDLLVRLLAPCRRPRRGPGAQAGADLPQAAPGARNEAARHRLRLGRLRPVRGHRARRAGHRCDSRWRAGPAGPGHLRRPVRRHPRVRLPRRAGAASTGSCRSE